MTSERFQQEYLALADSLWQVAWYILEDAAEGASPADRKLLLDACRRKLAEGSAIVWIAPALDPDVETALSPFSVSDPRLGVPESRNPGIPAHPQKPIL